jgi:FAD synthetase
LVLILRDFLNEGKDLAIMNTVLVAGKFDVLHPGHLSLFEKAKSFGDKLVVVVARDSTIRTRFGFEPTYSQEIRKQFLDALTVVDEAIIGNDGDEMEVLLTVRPDVVCLGYDQPIKEERVLEFANSHGLKLEVVRLEAFGEDLFKSSKIKAKVVEKRGREEVLP